MDLEKFLNNSGDSILQKAVYENGILSATISYGESDIQFHLEIRTSILKFSEHASSSNEIFKTFFLNMIPLQEKVNQNAVSGIYSAPTDFSQFMKDVNNDYHLCYGLKAKEYQYLVQFKGYGSLISCVIKDKEDFDFREKS
jgi:hypothetical protein